MNSGSQMPATFLLNNELQQQMHQQKLKSMQTQTTADTINNESIRIGLSPLQIVPYNEGITSQLQQLQQQHFIQQQRSQTQPQSLPGHLLLHGDLHRQNNSTIQSVSMAGNNIVQVLCRHNVYKMSNYTLRSISSMCSSV